MDVHAGQHKLAVVGHIPCITATRGAASGFFLPHMHRMTKMRELAVQMGLDDKAYDALAHGIPAGRVGHMLGNGIPTNLLQRVLPQLLHVADLVPCPVVDSWSQAFKICSSRLAREPASQVNFMKILDGCHKKAPELRWCQGL